MDPILCLKTTDWVRVQKQVFTCFHLSLLTLPPLGAQRFLETASPHLGCQPQTDSDSQPLLYGDCSGQAPGPAHTAASKDQAGDEKEAGDSETKPGGDWGPRVESEEELLRGCSLPLTFEDRLRSVLP